MKKIAVILGVASILFLFILLVITMIYNIANHFPAHLPNVFNIAFAVFALMAFATFILTIISHRKFLIKEIKALYENNN